MKTGSFSDYAKHAGFSPAYVTKLKAAGRIVIVRNEKGREMVNFDATDRLIVNTADLSRARNGANARGLRERDTGGSPIPETGATATLEGAGGDSPVPEAPKPAVDRVGDVFRQAQARRQVFEAQKSELEFKKMTGDLVDRETARRTVFDAFRTLRDHAFQAPQRAAARCVGLSDMREIEVVVADELRKAFNGWENDMQARLGGGA